MIFFKVNTDEEPMVFKAQLMALTGVQVILRLEFETSLLLSCIDNPPLNIPFWGTYLRIFRISAFLDILLHSGIDIPPPFQPERQKVMLKGAILGDQSWEKVN